MHAARFAGVADCVVDIAHVLYEVGTWFSFRWKRQVSIRFCGDFLLSLFVSAAHEQYVLLWAVTKFCRTHRLPSHG
jgi:hypothetical protein